MKNYILRSKQLDRQLAEWQKLNSARPSKGWIHTIRTALGMTAKQLAKRIGVHRTRIVQLERAELDDAVTLRSLRAAAKELDCELVYALIPQKLLQTTLEQKAREVARRRVQAVAHSMLLEDQTVDPEQLNEQVEELAKKLLDGSLKHLWDEK